MIEKFFKVSLHEFILAKAVYSLSQDKFKMTQEIVEKQGDRLDINGWISFTKTLRQMQDPTFGKVEMLLDLMVQKMEIDSKIDALIFGFDKDEYR
jgi:hypothetical protein